MAEATRNLCAQIPVELHDKVRQRQIESDKTLSQYMTWLVAKFYEEESKTKMTRENERTVAFQVPEELFEQFKEYLRRSGIKQKEFFLDCIQRALEEESRSKAEE